MSYHVSHHEDPEKVLPAHATAAEEPYDNIYPKDNAAEGCWGQMTVLDLVIGEAMTEETRDLMG